MAYKFVEKRRTAQEGTAYIAYMIIGSYFKKEICRSPFAAARLHLYYRDLGAKKQEDAEQSMIAQADKALKDYENVLALMNCDSVIRFGDGKYLLDFITGFEHIHAEVDEKGRCEIRIQ